MRDIIRFPTAARKQLVDISDAVQLVVAVYAQGATGAILIQENWDENVQSERDASAAEAHPLRGLAA